MKRTALLCLAVLSVVSMATATVRQLYGGGLGFPNPAFPAGRRVFEFPRGRFPSFGGLGYLDPLSPAFPAPFFSMPQPAGFPSTRPLPAPAVPGPGGYHSAAQFPSIPRASAAPLTPYARQPGQTGTPNQGFNSPSRPFGPTLGTPPQTAGYSPAGSYVTGSQQQVSPMGTQLGYSPLGFGTGSQQQVSPMGTQLGYSPLGFGTGYPGRSGLAGSSAALGGSFLNSYMFPSG